MTVLATPYALERAQLQADTTAATWPSPEAGFLDYLHLTTGTDAPQRPLVTDRLDETPMLASAGYQYATPHFTRPPQYDEEWARHFQRLAQRQAFPIDRESYFYRPLDLLGICIGARYCPALEDQDRSWLHDILQQGRNRLTEGTRAYYLGSIAAAQLGIRWPVHAPRITDAPLPLLSLLYWMNQPALATALTVPEQELASAILTRAFTATDTYDDLADAGLILYTTQNVVERTIQSRIQETWRAPLNTADAAALVQRICDRFPIVATTLTQRHDARETIRITDEYDVQDLLGALLKLHFDDVRPEEWTPSYAGNSSRIDFLLKPEQVAVEIKMTRNNLGQKEIVNQLAVDILRYQSHPDCKTLICFIYDPACKCSNPTGLEHDLTKNHGTLQVVVLVRPKHQ
jgi:REase_DpnII-MboI